jgi:cation transport ATPase
MALIQYDATTERSGKSLLDTVRGYFVQYRLALYLLSGAAVALGVAFNWNWLTAAALLRVVAVLPCALMMFRCMRHGSRGLQPDEAAAPQTSANPQ